MGQPGEVNPHHRALTLDSGGVGCTMSICFSLRMEKEPILGYTSDLRRRLREHNKGYNKSTKGNSWKLVYYEAFLSEEDARDREKKLKQRGSTKYKLLKRLSNSLKQDR